MPACHMPTRPSLSLSPSHSHSHSHSHRHPAPHPRGHLHIHRHAVRYRLLASSSSSSSSSSTSTASSSLLSSSSAQQNSPVDDENNNSPPQFSLELVAIVLVYLSQGALGMPRLALSYFAKDTLHLAAAATSLFTSATYLPWLIKPLYGFMSDSVPIFGSRRKSYLVLCGALGTVSWLALAALPEDTGVAPAIGLLVLTSLSAAVSDVVVDSIVVARARDTEAPDAAGSLQSLCWASAAVGGVATALYAGKLVEEHSAQFVFAATAALPLAVLVSAAFVQEVEEEEEKDQDTGETFTLWSSLRAQASQLWDAVRAPEVLAPTAFIFLWQATPSCGSALFFFQTSELGFTPSFLGSVQLATSLASLAGVGLYNLCLKQQPLRRVLAGAAIGGTAVGMTQLLLVTGANRSLGIPDEAFALGDSIALTVAGQVAFMPILVLAARTCPIGVEATMFASLMSVLNAGSAASGALGAGLTSSLGVGVDGNFENLPLLVFLCNASSLVPLVAFPLLESVLSGRQDEEE
ncbi:folate/biopterin transporter [Pseudoscourfieldia marina]